MLLSAKSPLSFCYGAVVSLSLLYLWRISSFGFDVDPYLGRKAPQTVDISNERSSSSLNETATEPAVTKYSIQDAVSNSTLGVSLLLLLSRTRLTTCQFEHILAINLPSRSDRRDLLTLGALQTDVELEWIDGVQGAEILPKAWVRYVFFYFFLLQSRFAYKSWDMFREASTVAFVSTYTLLTQPVQRLTFKSYSLLFVTLCPNSSRRCWCDGSIGTQGEGRMGPILLLENLDVGGPIWMLYVFPE